MANDDDLIAALEGLLASGVSPASGPTPNSPTPDAPDENKDGSGGEESETGEAEASPSGPKSSHAPYSDRLRFCEKVLNRA